jgi:hypothetical protein
MLSANWRKMMHYIHADINAKQIEFLPIDIFLLFLHTYKDMLQRPVLKNLG